MTAFRFGTTFRLALRNLLGAGFRTWLNVIVLSLALVVVVMMQGMLDGFNRQAADAMVATEYGGGQYWHKNYDPYDPLSLTDAHGPVPRELAALVREELAAPILVVPGSIYRAGRIQPVLVKGIDPAQTALSLPTRVLASPGTVAPDVLSVLIGSRMAKSTGLREGDYVLVQWRDVHGTFDAREARIVRVMSTMVSTVDNGQVWVPLDPLRKYVGMADEATLVVASRKLKNPAPVAGWNFQSVSSLLKPLHDVIRSKGAGRTMMFGVLLLLALLAVFDTQVLSIFRRRREIGTLMALGMARSQVMALFTLEGGLHAVLAAVLGAVWGTPLLVAFARSGVGMPQASDQFGLAIGEKIFPVYGAGLVLETMAFVFIVTTIVSYLPTRQIARLKPTEALQGKRL